MLTQISCTTACWSIIQKDTTNKIMKANLNHSIKMKCDFNCNHVHTGYTPLKPDAAKMRVEESCASDNEMVTCKDCAKECHNLLHNTSPRNLDLKTEGRPVHNKENQQVLCRLGEDAHEMETLENSRINEDSGYSSMLSTQSNDPTDHEDSIPLAGNIFDTPKHYLIKNQSRLQLPKKTSLPVTHFEELICSTLKKSGKRNLGTWAIVDRIISRESIGLQNLIGRKMGLDRIDILSELFRREFRHLLANILRHLDELDLINVAKVSTTWKKILQQDKWASQLYSKAVKHISDSNAKPSEHAATREYVLCRAALASVQKAVPPSISCKKSCRAKAPNQNSPHSRLVEFSEAAKTLKNTESLKVCSRCGSPAKYDSYLQRATCSRESCNFDFCTKCLCSYHCARDCMSNKPVKSSFNLGPLPGTKKSKQHLRRL
ncbi:F-box only protein 5 isoform X1 [Alligator sinensis]|uniref:F-box only protein 5 isoform X1 n=2 Tax=Alligator sinensis TaxID=38654 RepID=A0A1U7S3E5_ALLSI|nr:F-box only protein 5 isoform X1 [Alligator sinensis]